MVANDNQDSIDIIKSYPWSTGSIVTRTGNSYWTGYAGPCPAGDVQPGDLNKGAANSLSTNGGITGGDKAWVVGCNQLLLLSRPTSSNNKYPTYQAGWNLLPGATVSGHIVTYKGMDYQTITGLDPYGPGSRPEEASTICESTPAAIPDGWGLAEDNAATIDVIKTFPWSSQYAVVKDGARYGTNLTNAGNRYVTTGAIRNVYGDQGQLSKASVASGSCNSVVLLSRQSTGGGNNNGGGGTKCQKNWYWNSGDGQCTQHCPLHSQTRNSARQCICESGGSNVTCIEGTHCVNNACVDGNPSPRVFISGHLIGSHGDHTMHLWTPYAPGIAGGTINGPTEITNTAASPAFQNAQNNTFNSILIDKDTTFTMYSGENGTGKSWTRTGPILLWGGDNSAQMDEWEQIGGSATVGDQTAWNGKLDTSFYEESTLPTGCMLELMGDWCCISSGGSFQISTPQGGNACVPGFSTLAPANLDQQQQSHVNSKEECRNTCNNNTDCAYWGWYPNNLTTEEIHEVLDASPNMNTHGGSPKSWRTPGLCYWLTKQEQQYAGDLPTAEESNTMYQKLCSWGGKKNCSFTNVPKCPRDAPPKCPDGWEQVGGLGADIGGGGIGGGGARDTGRFDKNNIQQCADWCTAAGNQCKSFNWESPVTGECNDGDRAAGGRTGGTACTRYASDSLTNYNQNAAILCKPSAPPPQGCGNNCCTDGGNGNSCCCRLNTTCGNEDCNYYGTGGGGNRGGNGGWQNNDGELSVGQGAVYVNVDGNSYEECYGNSCCSIYGGCCQACNTWCDGYWCGNYNNNPTGFSSIDLGDDSVYVNVAN